MTTDEQYMALALELARQSIGLASPNPLVGAVIVRDGKIIGEGSHTFDGRRHAEILALEETSQRGSVQEATLYVNLEPCCHQGRTGPCTEAIISAGIKRVLAAMNDPNPLVSGQGFDRLRAAGIEVVTGIFEIEARKLNEAFAKWIRTRSPFVTLKSALTLDGKIGKRRTASGEEQLSVVSRQSEEEEKQVLRYAQDDNLFAGQRWITGEPARAHVQELRHAADAILVGIGTVIADDPLLTDRTDKPRRRRLLRVVLDSDLRLPLESRLVQSAQDDVIVFCASNKRSGVRDLELRGIRVERVSPGCGGVNLHEVMTRLGEMDITSALIEGGSRINGAALAVKVVDKLFLYFAPRLMGEHQSIPFSSGPENSCTSAGVRLRNITQHRFAEDFAVEGYLRDPYATAIES